MQMMNAGQMTNRQSCSGISNTVMQFRKYHNLLLTDKELQEVLTYTFWDIVFLVAFLNRFHSGSTLISEETSDSKQLLETKQSRLLHPGMVLKIILEWKCFGSCRAGGIIGEQNKVLCKNKLQDLSVLEDILTMSTQQSNVWSSQSHSGRKWACGSQIPL